MGQYSCKIKQNNDVFVYFEKKKTRHRLYFGNQKEPT